MEDGHSSTSWCQDTPGVMPRVEGEEACCCCWSREIIKSFEMEESNELEEEKSRNVEYWERWYCSKLKLDRIKETECEKDRVLADFLVLNRLFENIQHVFDLGCGLSKLGWYISEKSTEIKRINLVDWSIKAIEAMESVVAEVVEHMPWLQKIRYVEADVEKLIQNEPDSLNLPNAVILKNWTRKELQQLAEQSHKLYAKKPSRIIWICSQTCNLNFHEVELYGECQDNLVVVFNNWEQVISAIAKEQQTGFETDYSPDELSWDESALCKICYEKFINCCTIPCGHMSMCYNCGVQLQSEGFPCPICRACIYTLVRTFRAPINMNLVIHKKVADKNQYPNRDSNSDAPP